MIIKYYKYILFFFIVLVSVISCNDEKKKYTEEDLKQFKEPLIRVNKYLFDEDIKRIDAYIKRRKWTMKVSGTGLYYSIYKKGNGKRAETETIATIKYKVSLLDGIFCYDSDSLGVKTFKIGSSYVEDGLEEGILLMQEGDKAHFIIPPYMAYGLSGDNNKIPPRSIIVYDVELLKVSR